MRTPSHEPRSVALCPLADRCGGCSQQQVPYADQLAAKRTLLVQALDGFVEPANVPPVEGLSPPWGYRTRLLMPALPVLRPRPGQPPFRLGFYERGSTRLVEAVRCPVQHPLSLEVLARVRELLADAPLVATAARTKGGWLHGICVRVEPRSGAAELCLVGRTAHLPGGEALAERLATLPGVAGVHLSVNPGRSSYLMGSEFIHLAGRRRTVFHVGGEGFPLSPGSFFQTSAQGAERLAALVLAALPERMACLADLYGGVGVFARLARPRWRRAVVAESNPHAVEDLRWWLEREGLRELEVLAGRAEDTIDAVVEQRPDAVVLDPPRVGCHPRVLAGLAKARPAVVVYVSCNPEALTRDLGPLVQAGYRVDSVAAVDMFPHTEHLETVVRLRQDLPACPRTAGALLGRGTSAPESA